MQKTAITLAAILMMIGYSCTTGGEASTSRPFRSCLGIGSPTGRDIPLDHFDWITDIGATWIRAECWWAYVETQPGVYAIPDDAQQGFDEAHRRGINIILHLGYSNDPSARGGENGIYENAWDPDAYARYAAFMAQALRGKVQAFHCINEPHNFGFMKYYGGEWNGAGDSPWIAKYAELVRKTAAAVHEVAPEIPVMPDEDVWVNHYRFLDADLGPYVTALSVHPYTHGPTPPEISAWNWAHPCAMAEPYQVADEDGSLVSVLRRLREKAKEVTGRDFEIWATEWGYVVPEWVDEQTAAGYLVRMYVVSFANAVRIVGWHCLRDDVFGLVDNDGNKRATFFAYKNMAQTLGDLYLLRQVRGSHTPTRGVQAYLFGKGRRKVLVLWNISNRQRAVTVSGLQPGAQIIDTFGKETSFELSGGTAAITVDGQPRYIIGVTKNVSVGRQPRG